MDLMPKNSHKHKVPMFEIEAIYNEGSVTK